MERVCCYVVALGKENVMPIKYKIDILAALKESGYNTNTLRKEKLLSEGVIQALRENKYISLQNVSKICELLNCQPGDLMEYVKDRGEEKTVL